MMAPLYSSSDASLARGIRASRCAVRSADCVALTEPGTKAFDLIGRGAQYVARYLVMPRTAVFVEEYDIGFFG